ncbi:methyltransferase domain-containing protein [Pseudooceanicola sp. 216_PA32_1]|uniref:Methyltransferase domain-containing protein n=1 Tax=Pseudooceanicola pacificus TaxID=2676438 RepID=A0A844W1P8_9RHOB|nr:class I SAM-dependent methyltransferase [Pseudooceanicola pacificus]MWB76731.1 methyltransferase domain-containing protein [Pseudooceanicola pacificus]
MADRETLDVYAQRTAEYAARSGSAKEKKQLDRFLDALPQGARVLDLGCGPGDSSARMAERGFDPDPVDASPEMVAHARDTWHLPARVQPFAALESEGEYDGVWANFSLLHATKADLPGHLSAIRRALKPGGLFAIGMKTGEGERRDRLGRFYAYYSLEELRGLLASAGFIVTGERTGGGTGLDGTGFAWCLLTARAG